MQTITIIGGLEDEPDRTAFLARLNQRASGSAQFDWIPAPAANHRNPLEPYFGKFLRRTRAAHGPDSNSRIVKLFLLHGRAQAALYNVAPDPVRVPREVNTSALLEDWLFSLEANLIPRREWRANVSEAALVAILAKLVKNKSWNKDTQGHHWTGEADLLGQAPVDRRDFPMIRIEATRLLPTLRHTLLLSKGANQGKTKKEWCIRYPYVSAVKQMFLKQSLSPLAAIDELRNMINSLQRSTERPFELSDEIVSEKVRAICGAETESPVADPRETE